jgi:hypothetical protein
MNTREKFTTINSYRMDFLSLLYDAPDGAQENVPSYRRKDFDDHVEFNNQRMLKWFEEICMAFGSPSGMFESIPRANQVEASRYLEMKAAYFRNACKYELAIFRIELRENAATAAKPKPQKVVVSPKGVTTADLL